jgi:hypothetical protein
MDEHITRFNADAGHPNQQPNHGVWPGLSEELARWIEEAAAKAQAD